MPRNERKTYTKELKITAVYLMKSGVMKTAEICSLLGGLDRQTVHRWVQEYDAGGEDAFEQRQQLDGETLVAYQRKIKDLTIENEILKKATAYFAKKNKRG